MGKKIINWTIMKKQFLSYISASIVLLVFLSFHSCSSCSSSEENESDKRTEYAKIAENRTAQDLLDDLFIGCDGDVESLARILGVTPSTIDRIRKGKSEATAKFEEKIRQVTVYYYQNDQSFIKLRSVIDEEWGWYDSVLKCYKLHPYWFWGINIFFVLCLLIDYDLFGFEVPFSYYFIPIELLIGLIAWLCSLFFSPNNMEDKYIDTINPVVEQLL